MGDCNWVYKNGNRYARGGTEMGRGTSKASISEKNTVIGINISDFNIPRTINFDNKGFKQALSNADLYQKEPLQDIVRKIISENEKNETYNDNINFAVKSNGVIIVEFDKSEFVGGNNNTAPNGIKTIKYTVGINGIKNGVKADTPKSAIIRQVQKNSSTKNFSQIEKTEIRKKLRQNGKIRIKDYL